MNIRGKVTHTSLDPGIQGTAIGQMTPKTHTGSTDTAIACGQGQKIVHTQAGVFVVSRQFLKIISR